VVQERGGAWCGAGWAGRDFRIPGHI